MAGAMSIVIGVPFTVMVLEFNFTCTIFAPSNIVAVLLAESQATLLSSLRLTSILSVSTVSFPALSVTTTL